MPATDDEAKILDQWSHRLAHALQLLDLDFDRELILDLAGESARSVTHAAAPITALMVGYAAGLAAGARSTGTTGTATGSGGSKEDSAAAVPRLPPWLSGCARTEPTEARPAKAGPTPPSKPTPPGNNRPVGLLSTPPTGRHAACRSPFTYGY